MKSSRTKTLLSEQFSNGITIISLYLNPLPNSHAAPIEHSIFQVMKEASLLFCLPDNPFFLLNEGSESGHAVQEATYACMFKPGKPVCVLNSVFIQIAAGFSLNTFATAWVPHTFTSGTCWMKLIRRMLKFSTTSKYDFARKPSLGKVFSRSSMLTRTWYLMRLNIHNNRG
jgi:hypothetical protein